MKKLYVHIGVLKTGSTAIQAHFSVYDGLHRLFGFRYPRLGEERYRNQEVADDIKTSAGQFATHPAYLDLIRKSFCRRFLVSAEKIFSLPRGPEYFSLFKAECEVRIVVFVRRQDRYLESVYRQLVKNTVPALAQSFEQFAEIWINSPKRRQRLDWLACLKPWEDAFGLENMFVIPYDEYSRINSIDVMADCVGLPIAKRMPRLGEKYGNPSLSGETVVLLRHLRTHGIPFQAKRIRAFDALVPNPSSAYLSVAGRRRLIAQFRPENAALGRHYGVDVSPLLAFDETIEAARKQLDPENVDIAGLLQLARSTGLIPRV